MHRICHCIAPQQLEASGTQGWEAVRVLGASTPDRNMCPCKGPKRRARRCRFAGTWQELHAGGQLTRACAAAWHGLRGRRTGKLRLILPTGHELHYGSDETATQPGAKGESALRAAAVKAQHAKARWAVSRGISTSGLL
jgi:hypothetical protein